MVTLLCGHGGSAKKNATTALRLSTRLESIFSRGRYSNASLCLSFILFYSCDISEYCAF